VLLALPGLILAVVGGTHPHHLTAQTAQWWSDMHVLALPLFPLLGVAQWVLLAGAPTPLRWGGRAAAFGYATFYTGLDAVAGIAAGALVDAQGGWGRGVSAVFDRGEWLGHVGAWCFLAASVAITVTYSQRYGAIAGPGSVLLVVSSAMFLSSHIFWPGGVVTMLGLAAGMALLDYAAMRSDPARWNVADAPVQSELRDVGA